MHEKPHEHAGRTLRVARDLATNPPVSAGELFKLEDWHDRIGGPSWALGAMQGNMACIIYANRGGDAGLPADDEVVYGKVGYLGHLVHVTELGEVVPA